jgi:hypothetical protein
MLCKLHSCEYLLRAGYVPVHLAKRAPPHGERVIEVLGGVVVVARYHTQLSDVEDRFRTAYRSLIES